MAGVVSRGEWLPVAEHARAERCIAVVCVTHNSAEVLPEFLASVPPRAGDLPVELHVVDSGSTDSTVEEVRRVAPDAVVHILEGNRGFAAGINAAVTVLAGQDRLPAVVLIVNPDVRFCDRTADELVLAIRDEPTVGVATPRLVGQDGRLQLSLRRRPSIIATWAEAVCGGPIAHRVGLPTEVVRDRRAYEVAANVGWATGGFLAVSWDCLLAVGAWDESYFLYEEEVDFCLRAIDHGFSVRYTPNAVGVRILDTDRTAPWIHALMRVNRVRHMRRRSGRTAAALVQAGLLVGETIRGAAGRPEARAGLWALTAMASVEEILRRYRPGARAVLVDRSSACATASPAQEVARVLRAYALGLDIDGVETGPELLRAARLHQVLGVVCNVLDCGPVGDAVRRATAARSLHQDHALAVAGRALDAAAVDWMLLKGPVLSELTYRVPGVRESADLDLLVRPADFERAVFVLQAAGARLIDTNWPLIRSQLRGELSLEMPDGVLVDLHWHVINDPVVRSETAVDTAELFRHARVVRVGSQTVRTPDEVDTAVYAAVHAWKSGGDRLKWMLDVQQSACKAGDLPAIRRRARALGVGLPTDLMLGRAERVIGALPGGLRDIGRCGRAWLHLDRVVGGTYRAIALDDGRWFSGRVVLRAARDGSAGPRAAARALLDVVRHRYGPIGHTPTQEDLHRHVESVSDESDYFAFVRRSAADAILARPHVLVVVENLSVPFDRRVWQQSTALVRNGYEVTVICPTGVTHDTEPETTIEGVRILRYPLRPADGGPSGYVREYAVALWHSVRLARKADRTRSVDAVHACNPPDLLLLVALPFKVLRGAVLIFDHHDLVPELFESRFGARTGLFFRISVLLERATFAVADGVISTNESYREVALRRGRMEPHRVRVVRSAPDLTRFTREEPDPTLRRGRSRLIAYLGVMGPQDGVDFALQALALLRNEQGYEDVHVVMMGGGDCLDDMLRLRDSLGLQDMVEFTGRVSDRFVRTCLSTADVCLAPDPFNPLNDVSTMNKIVEYMAMGRAIVSFDLKEARVSAGEASAYASANDVAEFARLIGELLDDDERRRWMGRVGRRRVESELSWERSEKELLEFYDALLSQREVRRS